MQTLFDHFSEENNSEKSSPSSPKKTTGVKVSMKLAEDKTIGASSLAPGVLTTEIVEEWAKDKSLSIEKMETEVGVARIIDNKIAIIIDPTGNSSQQLRSLQAEFKKNGVSLYYIYRWELQSQKLLWHFESKLGLDSRKYAAKRLRIEEVSNDVGNEFMKRYHIQGTASGAGKVSIALKEKETGEVLAVQQFSRNRWAIKKGEGAIANSPVWEGLRLCFKPGVQIYGGASRLQRFFEKKYKPEKILSYINASHSDGSYKASQGFTEITNWTQLSFMWVLEGEPKTVRIIDKFGKERFNDLDKSRAKRFLNPTTVAGAFGGGVGGLFYGGRLGSRAQLREHEENGLLVHNDVILEAIGYKKVWTPGQYKWEKVIIENAG